MTKRPKTTADIIPIDIEKRGKSLRDIPPFPYDPKALAKISKISAIKDINTRAEQCVLAGVNAEHEDGRRLLKSCCRGGGVYQDLCRLRLQMFIDMRRLDAAALRRQFSILTTGKKKILAAGQRVEYLDDRLFLLCNFLRNDPTALPSEFCATLEVLSDSADLDGPRYGYGASSYAGAARWVRGWLGRQIK